MVGNRWARKLARSGFSRVIGETSSITVFIKKLREKVEDDPASPQFILTRRGLGYLFHGEAQ